MTDRQDEQVTLGAILAVVAIFVLALALSSSGCAALERAAPTLLDVSERVIRAELDRVDDKPDAAEIERLQLVLDVVRACREAQVAAERARDDARVEADKAKASAEEAAARASAAVADAQSAARLAQAHAEAAAAAEKSAQAAERAAEASSRAAALEQRLVTLVPQALGQRAEADAGAGGGT
jgi:colicin import membrane protein